MKKTPEQRKPNTVKGSPQTVYSTVQHIKEVGQDAATFGLIYTRKKWLATPLVALPESQALKNASSWPRCYMNAIY